MAPTAEQAKKVYEENMRYVSKNKDKLNHTELYLFAIKQDALYLAWAFDDFSRLNPQ